MEHFGCFSALKYLSFGIISLSTAQFWNNEFEWQILSCLQIYQLLKNFHPEGGGGEVTPAAYKIFRCLQIVFLGYKFFFMRRNS